MCDEEGSVKQCGYLQHKGKKRLISMWRRWYCVLNGRLLLFYRSESDYSNLGKFHERLDLGLVYDVLPALGVENGIQISTHTGPHWLRTTDEKSFQLWLEALQASIVLKRQGSTLRKSKRASAEIMEKVSSPVSNRSRKAKSTINDLWFTSDDSESSVEKKIANPLSRFSLSFIPGHGKKYSTYDGNRAFRVEQSTNDEWDGKTKTDDDKKNATATPKLRKKPLKEPRPLSESVSNFLLLNSQSSENLKETKDEPVKAVEVEATVTPDKKKSHIPKLPTSFGVGKLLSHLQTTSGPTSSSRRHSKSMNSLLEVSVAVNSKQQKSSSQAEMDVEENKPPLFAKSEDVLSKRASDASSVDHKSPVVIEESELSVIVDQTDCPPEPKEAKIDVQISSPSQEASVCAGEDGRDQEILDDKKKDKKKAKDSSRRKSGLAMLKQFFSSAKIGIKRKGESVDKDKLSVNDARSRKSSNESAATSEKSSARTSLIIEADAQQEIQCDKIPQQKQSTEAPEVKEVLEIPSIVILQRLDSQISEGVQSVQEEAFVATNAYKYEAKIIEVVEPKSLCSDQSDPDLPPSNPEEIDPPTPPQSSEDEFTNLSKSTRNSFESAVSLEKTILNNKSRKLSDLMTKEDMEVAELRPSLPLKTKVKCPSPGYDVPRTSPIPIPCPEQVKMNSDDPVEVSCVVLESLIATEKESPEMKSSSCFPELQENASTADCTTSATSVRRTSVSHLIQTFNNDSILNSSTPTSAFSKRDSLNKPKHSERRISFAQAETEMVQEEMVHILAFDSSE